MGFTPVVQKALGWPNGECVRAAYASLLDLPIEAVPKFDPGSRQEKHQIVAERKWLRSRGLDLVVVPGGGASPLVPDDLYHMLAVMTTRGYGHRVVGRGGKVIWDPHPGGSKITSIMSYYFVVPLRKS